MTLTRRHFWLSLLGAFATPFGLYGYMRREATRYQVTHTDIELPRIEKPLDILHLSDIHFSEDVSFEQVGRAISIVQALEKPDLICLTGDYITSTFPDTRAFRQTLTPLAEIAPTFAVIGNHDFSRTDHGSVTFTPMIQQLQKCGFTVLFNEMQSLDIDGQTIEIAGLGDIWSGTCRPQETFPEPREMRPLRIALSHNPDSKKNLYAFDWDLMLSGHTHGGQIRVPFTNIRPVLPLEDRAFTTGLYDWSDRKIFITRGIGNLHGLRFNCPPEISILHLKPAFS